METEVTFIKKIKIITALRKTVNSECEYKQKEDKTYLTRRQARKPSEFYEEIVDRKTEVHTRAELLSDSNGMCEKRYWPMKSAPK